MTTLTNYALLTVALFSSTLSFSQVECTYDPHVHGGLELSSATLNATARIGSGDTLFIGLKYHVVSGTNGIANPAPSADILDRVNEMFRPHAIQFVHCGPYLFYVDDDIYGDSNQAFAARDLRTEPGLINVFVVGGTTFPATGGYAESGKDRLVLPRGNLWATSMAHEIGHVLGLPHTFNAVGTELVDGSNCSIAGDLFCDTPADPFATYLDLDSCTYITGATDANGDTYMPDMQNIMSYAPRFCTQHFSVEQGLRMYNVLENTKWHLQRFTGVVGIELQNSIELCENDPNAYSISATPTGGSFSGPGVGGNMFEPALAGQGEHAIAYTLPAATDPIVLTHQYHTNVQGVQMDTLTEIWQSMRMENMGELLLVKQLLKLEQQSDLTIDVFAGTGTGGTLLYSNTNTFGPTMDLEWLDLSTDSLPIDVNDTLTYRVTSNQPMIVKKANVLSSGYYLDGTCNWGNTDSHFFAAYVRTLPPCGSTSYFYVMVRSVEPGSITGLNGSYCVSGDTIDLYGVPSNGTFTVNTSPATAFDPIALGLGTHTVAYTSSDVHGCVSTVVQLVVVEPFPVLFPPAFGPFCDTLPAQAHGATPVGGQLMVDGSPVDSIYPGQLSIGTHSADYFVEVLNDTVFRVDQSKSHVVGNQLWPLPTAQLDTSYWQSFTPQISGFLDRIEMPFFNWDQQTFEVFLYDGVGVQGNLIYMDTVSYTNSVQLELVDLVAPDEDLPIMADSTYTVGFRWIAGPASPPVTLVVDSGNTYVQGLSMFDDTLGVNYYDIYFQETVRQYRYCRDSVSTQFNVQDCLSTGIAVDQVADVLVFPNPSSGDIQVVSNVLINEIILYNTLGELLLRKHIHDDRLELDDLAPGFYTLSVFYKKGEERFKLIVR